MKRESFNEENIDLKAVFFKYLPYWKLIVLGIVLSMAVAFFYNYIEEPVYRVHSKVLISDPTKTLNQNMLMAELGAFATRSGFHDQIVILSSRTMIDSVLRQMNQDVYYFGITNNFFGIKRKRELYEDAPFRVDLFGLPGNPDVAWAYAEGSYSTKVNWDMLPDNTEEVSFTLEILDERSFVLLGNRNLKIPRQTMFFGQVFNNQLIRFSLNQTERFDPGEHIGETFMFTFHKPDAQIRKYVENLQVEPHNRDAWVLDVFFEATHQGRAEDFVNSLTTYFVKTGLHEKNQMGLNTIRFIDEQILVTTDSLRIAESNLQNFRRDHQIVDVSLMAEQLLVALKELDQQKSIEEVKQQYYDYLITYLQRDEGFEEVFGPSALGIEDRLLNELIQELSRLYSERARLLLTTTERSPLVQAINLNISKARSTLKENITSMQSASNILLDDINRRIMQLERRISGLPQTEQELLNIQRRFNLSDATYTFLLEKRAEAGIAMASNVPDNQIVDRASFDRLVAPQSARNYAIALLLGFFLPLGFIIIKDFFNTKILNKNEVTEKVSFPLVGIIPHCNINPKLDQSNLVIFENPRSRPAEAFRSLRSNLQFIMPNEGSKTVVVTSTGSGEGKSFSALNLACVFAISGKKTVLIYADLRKPRMEKSFNLVREPGLTNYLIGKSSYKEILQNPIKGEPLSVIATGPLPPNPTELLENPRMNQLLNDLRKDFSYIIIDTPPVGLVPDAMALMKNADTTLYITRQKVTERSALDFINDFSEKTGIQNLCLEINDVEITRLDNRFGYGYGYGYGYGDDTKENESDVSIFERWGAKLFNGNNRKSNGKTG